MRKDIDFNFTPHPMTGDLIVLKGNNAISQSLKTIVQTSFYERGFNVVFGTNVRSSLFEVFTPLDILSMKNYIEEAIKNFEPNVELIDAQIGFMDNDGHGLDINIIYTLINSAEPQSTRLQLHRIR